VDGVAPRAKMNQQRSRRFRTAQEINDKREVFKAHRRVYHSTLGLRVINKKKVTCLLVCLKDEYGACQTVTAKFWPWLSGKRP